MSSVDVLEVADCEEVTVLRDRRAGAVAILAVHDTRLGPAHGANLTVRNDAGAKLLNLLSNHGLIVS